MRNYGEGLIYHTNEWGKLQPLTKDIYIFSYIDREHQERKWADIVFTGFALKKDVEKYQVKKGYRGNGHLNYIAKFSQLRSITKLLEAKNQYYGI